MKKFNLFSVFSTGYERSAKIRVIETQEVYNVYYMQPEQYYEGAITTDEQAIVEGYLKMIWVVNATEDEGDLFFEQPTYDSAHTRAVVKVTKVIDDYLIFAMTSVLPWSIAIAFETSRKFEVGQKIMISGALAIDFEDE